MSNTEQPTSNLPEPFRKAFRTSRTTNTRPRRVRGSSRLHFDPLQPLFTPELPSAEDMGFEDELEMALWLGIEAEPTEPEREQAPRWYTLDNLPYVPMEQMLAHEMQERGWPLRSFEQCVPKSTVEYYEAQELRHELMEIEKQRKANEQAYQRKRDIDDQESCA
ncbi:hypothetical protein [Ktedonospora formicarum]|uniref:Uncharacterized protein n=1 Tax=Ktedonospora formicarum TaxID=2778364 RepID=A0A8J3I6Z4_9CHLR|nr:hypothetical protein [Ktedonospora formicarum]GHO47985.1 hypothetical protein KSX_61480 [Ktedonospora formicarum]